MQAVWERVQYVNAYAVQELQRAGVRILNGTDADTRAGILIIEGGKERQAVMHAAGIPAQLRGAGIRLGIHFYHNGQEVHRLAEVLRGA